MTQNRTHTVSGQGSCSGLVEVSRLLGGSWRGSAVTLRSLRRSDAPLLRGLERRDMIRVMPQAREGQQRSTRGYGWTPARPVSHSDAGGWLGTVLEPGIFGVLQVDVTREQASGGWPAHGET